MGHFFGVDRSITLPLEKSLEMLKNTVLHGRSECLNVNELEYVVKRHFWISMSEEWTKTRQPK